jgi:hypothetical protein
MGHKKGSVGGQGASPYDSRSASPSLVRIGLAIVSATVLVACRPMVESDAPAAACPAGGPGDDVSLENFRLHHRDAGSCPDAMTSDARAPDGAPADAVAPDAAMPDAAADASMDSGGAIAPDASATEGGTSGIDAAAEDATIGATDAGIDVGSPTDSAAAGIDASIAESGAPPDAAQNGAEGGACGLTAVPSSPFVPLSGTAALTGTEGIVGTQPLPGGGGCVGLVTNPAAAVMTFSFTGMQSPTGGVFPSGCSFSGVGSGSTFGVAPTFDGDTYTCNETFGANSPPADKAMLCPEVGNHNTGITASVRLSVTRSTGAVSLVRRCDWASTCPMGFPTGANGGFASEFNLSGFVSCPVDAGLD